MYRLNIWQGSSQPWLDLNAWGGGGVRVAGALRVLADRVEPAMQLLVAVRNAWRAVAWQLEPHAPRIWRT